MTEHKFVDSTELTGTRRTSDGYMVADVRCARTGCQDYLARELGIDRDGVITVYRPEQAVFNRDSMGTYAGKPVTLNHPPVPVDASNWKDYAVGDVDSEVVRDGEFVRVHMKLMDALAIDAVEAGVREISMGYSTPIEMVDGTAPDGQKYQAVQTGPIRINHLALVKAARGGNKLRIGDSRPDNWGSAPFTMSDQKEDNMSDALKAVVLGDAVAHVSPADAATVEKFKADTAKALADAETAHAAALADANKALAKAEAERDEAQGKILSDADLDKRVAARAQLIADAQSVAKGLKVEGLGDAEIRKAAVAKVHGDKAVEGRSQDYIDARFDLMLEGVGDSKHKTDPVGQILRAGPANLGDAETAEAAAHAKMVADFNPSKEA